MKYKYNNEWKDLKIKASDTVAIGTIVPFGGNVAPTNWLICDGSAVSRTTYADLFAVIGTNFGEGDGSTTFNLPDLRDRTPVGVNASGNHFKTVGSKYGEETHTLTVAEMPSHNHNILYSTDKNKSEFATVGPNGSVKEEHNGYIKNTGGNQPHNNIQPSLATNFIIKAFQSAGVMSGVAKTKTTSDNDTYSCNYINNLAISGGGTGISVKILDTSLTFEANDDISKSITVAYPEGYTKSNCFPVAFGCKGTRGIAGLKGYNYGYSNNDTLPSLTNVNGGFNRDLFLNDDNIEIKIYRYDTSVLVGVEIPIRVVLMKIS